MEQFFADAVDLQNGLGIRDLHADVGGNKVDQLTRIVQVDGCHQQLVRQLRYQRHQSAQQIHGIAHQGFDLESFVHLVGQRGDPCAQVGFVFGPLIDADTLDALDQQPDRAIRGLDHAVDGGRNADLEHIVGARLFDFGIQGRHQANHLLADGGIVDEVDRPGLSYIQSLEGQGIDDDTSQGQVSPALPGPGCPLCPDSWCM